MLLAIAMMGGASPMEFIAGDTVVALPALGITSEAAAPLVINLLFFGHMLCYFPTLALTNSLALHNMTNAEKQFPLIRVFGTIGWIVAGIFVSWQGWDASVNLFYVAAAAAIVMGLYSFTLPHTPPPSKGKAVSFSEIMGFDALVLFRKPSFLIFMLCSFLVCIPLAFYYQMASKFIAQGGLANPAFKMSFGQMSEIVFMLLMPLFFARLGVKWMLFVGMLAWVVRYTLFAFGANDSIMWMLLAGIVLHGICYDFFFVTGQIYTDRVAPKEIRGQAQGLLVLCTLGLGMLIGAQLAGKVEVNYTPPESARLKAEADYIGYDAQEQKKALDKSLEEADATTKEQFEQAKTDLATLVEVTSGIKAMLQSTLARATDPVNDEFNEAAEKATADVQAEIDRIYGEIDKLQANPAGDVPNQIAIHQQQILQLESVQEQLVILNKVAETYSQGRLEKLDEPLPSSVEPLALQQEKIDRLNAYKGLKSLQADQAENWQMIWTLPAIFAGVIMIFFALVFKDDTVAKKEADSVAAKPPIEASSPGSEKT